MPILADLFNILGQDERTKKFIYVLDVSRYIINYCNENYYLISNLKLQKILYFVQAFFLEAKNEECFREEIEAWDFGPVIPEVRAWTIKKGTKAPQAAGKIHSDIERGFIKAEVVSFEDLMKEGSMVAAREKGLVRQEGKEYIMQDGDIVLFKFNV